MAKVSGQGVYGVGASGEWDNSPQTNKVLGELAARAEASNEAGLREQELFGQVEVCQGLGEVPIA